MDNRNVVPFNAYLMKKYNAHINVEWCNQTNAVKYLFKYINKGPDRVSAELREKGCLDEIKAYLDCRYISTCEAAWRILGYPINYRSVLVTRLSFHLEGDHPVTYKDTATLDDVVEEVVNEESQFLAWFKANEKFPEAEGLTYTQFPSFFTWDGHKKEWNKRKNKSKAIGRVYHVSPSSGELYYLRILLNIQKSPTSFEQIRKVNGVVYDIYKEACQALGLFGDDKEYIEAITEAYYWGDGHYLRKMFVTLLYSNSLVSAKDVWKEIWHMLADGIQQSVKKALGRPDMKDLDEKELKEYTLVEIEKLLKSYGRTLSDYKLPPADKNLLDIGLNRFVMDELRFNRKGMAKEFDSLHSQLNSEQKSIFNTIMTAVDSGVGGTYFLHGYGGTGKTFMWRTLSSALRARGDIVLLVASSGISSLLLPLGRTGHSRFSIPLQLDESSTCNVKPNYPVVELLWQAKLIVWYEAPMVHKHCFEALDRTLKDVLSQYYPEAENLPFGGKVVVFGGDFRQILPVVQRGTRQEILNATINSSKLWHNCKVLNLTENMHLQSSTDPVEKAEIKSFADWLLRVGDGKEGMEGDGESIIDKPEDLIIKRNGKSPVAAIVDDIYKDFHANHHDNSFFKGRAILCPTNDVVSEVNEYMMSMLPGKEHVLWSYDSLDIADTIAAHEEDDLFSVEYLNTIKCSGLPNHEIKLKVGEPIMLLRNIDPSAGLCNGTRLKFLEVGKNVIQAEVMTGQVGRAKAYIPRLTLTPSDLRLPFKLRRRQYPIAVSFAMTINKSQGQSLDTVGIFLLKHVFSHGQLYVAISRVTSKKGLRFLITNKEGDELSTTTNVVYKEVFSKM